ncbi:hypothetical protein ABK040_004630 [Willaertia magna]
MGIYNIDTVDQEKEKNNLKRFYDMIDSKTIDVDIRAYTIKKLKSHHNLNPCFKILTPPKIVYIGGIGFCFILWKYTHKPSVNHKMYIIHIIENLKLEEHSNFILREFLMPSNNNSQKQEPKSNAKNEIK